MKVEINDEKYDKFQGHILCEIIKSTKEILEEKGVPEELIYDITGDLSFRICAIIDSSAVMEVDGEDVLPFLTFSKSSERRDTVIANDGGSYMHEMIYGFTDEIFEIDQ